MNGLISPVRVLKSFSTCRILWRECVSPELCGARSVRASCGNFYLKLSSAEQRPRQLCEQPAVQVGGLLPFARHKSSKTSKKGRKQMPQEESDEEDDPEKSDYEDQSEEEEEDTQPKAYRDLEKVVPSFRFDLIMKAGLDMARNKVEDSFYSNKLRLNGEKLLKKSKVVKEGDVLDYLIGEDQENETVTVMRIVVRKINEEMTNTDKYRVTLRCWKHLRLPRQEVVK